MTDRKISELPAAILPLAGDEVVPLVQGGETRNAAMRRLQYRDRPANYISGAWYSHLGPLGTTTPGNAPTGTFMLRPFYVAEKFVATEAAMEFAAIPVSRVVGALYAHDPVTGLPTGVPLIDSGLVQPVLARWVWTLGSPLTLQEGIYWVGTQCEGTCNFRGAVLASGWFLPQTTQFPSNAFNSQELRASRSFDVAPNIADLTLTPSGQVRGGHLFFKAA